ncbi:TonB-dependent receptor, partial [Candidatus Dependentiae bacterium]|nr:TonB-dependent receptor [Candidatus Dependentiae bacterium]
SGIDFLVGIRNDRHDNFGRETTYKTALNYTYEDFSLSLKSSYGKGFKAPSLYNLYSAYGSASLQPEISNNFDLAIYKYFKNGLCSLTYFNNRFKELIDFDYTNWIYYNVNRAKSYGYEFEFNYDFSSFPVMVDIQYTYMQTESANGKQLLLRPEHKGEAIINYDINNFKFSPSLRYVGKRYDVPYVEIPSHIIFDFYCKYKMKNCAIQFQLNNIANKQYEETEGYGAAGRNFVIGMDFNF